MRFPIGGFDAVVVADVAIEIILLDHFAQIGLYFGGRGDRRPHPRFEAEAEGIKIAIGTDAGEFVGEPGAAVTGLPFQYQEALVRQALLQVPGCGEPGNAGTDHQYIHIGNRAVRGRAGQGESVHRLSSQIWAAVSRGSGKCALIWIKGHACPFPQARNRAMPPP